MALLVAQAAATLILVGLIWTIQLVQYPLMDGVSTEGFVRYHARHTRRMGWLIAPLMPTELFTAAALVAAPPASVPPVWAWTGLILVLLIWIATAWLAVPAHRALARGFDRPTYRRLVQTNWVRTILWSLRGALALWMLVSSKGVSANN